LVLVVLSSLQEQQKNMTVQLGHPGTGLNTARRYLGGAGTQTAALGFGGYSASTPGETGATEEYDGSTWTTSPSSLTTARYSVSGAGTQTAGLAFGGTTPAGADQVLQKNTMVLLGQQEELWLQQEDI
jgi:hypothetical protein